MRDRSSLTASPTIEDLDTESTWHCPYCSETTNKLNDLRKHITETIDEAHKGIDGWSPTQDLVATNDEGEETRRVEGVEQPEQTPEHGEKKKRIINLWVLQNRDADIEATAEVADATYGYTSSILSRLNNPAKPDGISPSEWQEEHDPELKAELSEELDNYLTSDQSTKSMSVTQEELEDEPTKALIVNARLVAPDATNKAISDVLNCSEEYVRRVTKSLKEGDLTADDVEDMIDEDLQERLRAEIEVAAPDDVLPEGERATLETFTENTESTESTDDEYPERPAVLKDASKKSVILNSILLDEDLHYTDMSAAADSSDEYARRTVKEVKEGDIDTEALEDVADDDIQQALRDWYVTAGMIEGDTKEVEEPESEPVEADHQPVATTEPAQQTEDVTRKELRELRDELDTLREASEFSFEGEDSSARMAEFIAEKAISGIDNIIQTDKLATQ